MKAHAPSISVVVPTYRRPDYLRRCLEGLLAQTRSPGDIVVVRRADDEGTGAVLGEFAGHRLKSVTISQAGVLASMAAGVEEGAGDIIAFTDDDAVPRDDWLQRLLVQFDDRSVGGAGGRDVVHGGPEEETRLTCDVGRISKWGKVVGNHHIGTGPAREVMVLKGVNMAFRREALTFPTHLRGSGAQAHFEVALSLSARRQGWRLIYDPAVVVDHYPAPRFDVDQRLNPGLEAVRDAAYNLVLSLVAIEPDLFWRRAAYGLAIGDRAHPGLGRAAVAALRGEPNVVRHLIPSLVGQAQALVDSRLGAKVLSSQAHVRLTHVRHRGSLHE